MPYDELLGWQDYFNRRPYGWREDLRTSYLLRAAGEDVKPSDKFPSLKAIFEPKDIGEALQRSSLGGFLRGATGGDKLEFL